jgi:hypothetical protein
LTDQQKEQVVAIGLSMSLVLSAIRATIRYRDRVDRVLSLSTAAEGLPFALPQVPMDTKPQRDEMRRFFRTGEGQTLLVLNGLDQDFTRWDELLRSGHSIQGAALLDNFDQCTELYRRSQGIGLYVLQPQLRDPAMLKSSALSGSGDDARLAYFVVESDRLSKNSTLSRLVLITADTLLELLGEDASSFIAHPRTRSAVESLIKSFTADRDFDDESAREIFRRLLGAAVTTALEDTSLLPNAPLLDALYGAINDVRKELKQQANGNDSINQYINSPTYTRMRTGFSLWHGSIRCAVTMPVSWITKPWKLCGCGQ